MARRRAYDLWGRIASFEWLVRSARKAIRGKRKKPKPARFMADLETECLRLEHQLLAKTFRPGQYTAFEVKDPKRRMVSAAPFRDRVIHHALCDVIQPWFERGFIDQSFANRKGKGTHRAIECYERFRDRHKYVLRCDIWRYFPAIDHELLKASVRRRIGCADTLWLIDRIIDGSNLQEPMNSHFPGDDLLTPLERRRGLPIGNLTSQLFANVYLDGMDHWIKEVLRVPGYVRYVDDFALFGDDRHEMAEWRARLEGYLCGRRLRLHPRKTVIAETSKPAEFLGYVLLADGFRRLPEENVRRFRNRLRGLRDRWCAGTVTAGDVALRIDAWNAHADHAGTHKLRRAIFGSGHFGPGFLLNGVA